MSVVRTDLRIRPVVAARSVGVQPFSGVTSRDVQSALQEIEGQITGAGAVPPAMVPKAVNFAMSPYTILATDYLLEVDSTAGQVVLQTAASSTRSRRPFTVKAINANPNGILVNRAAAETIDGMTSYPIDTPYGAATFSPKLANDGYEVSS